MKKVIISILIAAVVIVVALGIYGSIDDTPPKSSSTQTNETSASISTEEPVVQSKSLSESTTQSSASLISSESSSVSVEESDATSTTGETEDTSMSKTDIPDTGISAEAALSAFKTYYEEQLHKENPRKNFDLSENGDLTFNESEWAEPNKSSLANGKFADKEGIEIVVKSKEIIEQGGTGTVGIYLVVSPSEIYDLYKLY
jgi:hypothetical protein